MEFDRGDPTRRCTAVRESAAPAVSNFRAVDLSALAGQNTDA
jgi:hypothetical protein